MFNSIFSKKVTLTQVINTRDIQELNRYSNDGFSLEFKGELVIATKTIKV